MTLRRTDNLAKRQRRAAGDEGGFVLPIVIFGLLLMGTMTVAALMTADDEGRSGRAMREASSAFSQTGASMVNSNSADTGGGVYVRNGTATVGGGQISENDAAYGGGVYIYTGVAALSGVSIISNTATVDGGGIDNDSGTMTLVNSTVSGNSATGGNGGGIFGSGTTAITFTTVASNTAASGGYGLHRGSGTLVVHNTIVAYNGTTSTNCGGASAITSNDYNLEYGDSCGFTQANDITGTIPLIAPLAVEDGTWILFFVRSSTLNSFLEKFRPNLYSIFDEQEIPRPEA